MTRDEIVQLAKEAGWPDWQLQLAGDTDDFHRLAVFAELIAAAERERCAKVCEKVQFDGYAPPEHGAASEYYNEAARFCAEEIRELKR